MSTRNVIVFGPTGSVGSAVARTAQAHGAKVFLALRDISKPVPGLTAAEERSLGYERIQADLTQPKSVHAAVSSTGASHAFIYATLGASPDHMLSTVEALKAAGIEQVVLLSSISVHGDVRAIQPTDFIAYEHAQVELSLENVFGPQGYVAVRPAYFASNSFWWKRQILEGEVKWAFPDLRFDFIAPEDIGAVCGTILAGAFEGGSPVLLAGPETDLSVAGAIETIGRAINKPVKVTKVSSEENIQVMTEKSGVPELVAQTLTKAFEAANEDQNLIVGQLSSEVRANVERHLKRPSLRFSEWVEKHKAEFAA